jgi:hypothetical protein
MEIGHSPINMFISGNAEPLPSGGQTAAPQEGGDSTSVRHREVRSPQIGIVTALSMNHGSDDCVVFAENQLASIADRLRAHVQVQPSTE